ncbi:MAG: kinase/pyrophosphorylase [Proteobacteria bacterium]|nr:kinase/pyrophosphorylase [Pseudomonadota bacterium]
MEPRSFHLHLVSDATGETLGSLARACMAQFEGVRSIEHLWPMVRNDRQIARVLAAVKAEPGVVLFTIVDDNLRAALEEGCSALNIPCIPVLDPVIRALGAFLGMESRGEPGRQHALDAEYFHRIEAMQFALAHDDGQSAHDLNKADVILVGVSRTSKTPTCIYLANRGLKAANVPFVPEIPLPAELLETTRPLIVGLTNDPGRLIQVRRNRLKLLDQGRETDYVDPDAVRDEVENAKRYFNSRQWPVIDVTRRSIEETAATVIQYHARRQRKEG